LVYYNRQKGEQRVLNSSNSICSRHYSATIMILCRTCPARWFIQLKCYTGFTDASASSLNGGSVPSLEITTASGPCYGNATCVGVTGEVLFRVQKD